MRCCSIYLLRMLLRAAHHDAKQEAERFISEALQLGHEQSTCWALAFNLCPIAIWRGELADRWFRTEMHGEVARDDGGPFLKITGTPEPVHPSLLFPGEMEEARG